MVLTPFQSQHRQTIIRSINLLFLVLEFDLWVLYSNSVRMDLISSHPAEKSNKTLHRAMPASLALTGVILSSSSNITLCRSSRLKGRLTKLNREDEFLASFPNWRESRREGRKGELRCKPRTRQLGPRDGPLSENNELVFWMTSPAVLDMTKWTISITWITCVFPVFTISWLEPSFNWPEWF